MDVRVEPRSDLNLDEFRALSEATRGEFPEIKDQLAIRAAFKLGEPSTQSIEPERQGFQFARPTRDKLFQAQRSGWAFNKLAPYETWEAFKEEGRALWGLYREIARPTSITRLALRYINRLVIPLPIADFKEYILTVPEVAPALPQGLSGFLMQLQIPQEDIEALTVLNVAMAGPSTPDSLAVTLDIDVFRNQKVPQSDDEMWAYFEQLRHRKNDVFEACITDAMRERFR